MTAQLPVIGFVGTGSMGTPMVECLHGKGHPLVLFDTNSAKIASLAAKVSGEVASHPAGLAEKSDIIITMLPTSAIVELVLQGEHGALAALKKGTIIIDMSSGVPAHTQRLAAAVAQAGGVLVDAPVSGGVPRACTGDLAIMFGGPEEALERVKPVLQAMGKTITRTGDVGTAHAMKALNNLVSAGGFLIGIEALLIGKQFGLEPDVMVDVLNASTGMSNSTQKKFKQFVLSRKFNSGFGLDLMVKDLSIAMSVANDCGVPVPFGRLCREMWASAAHVLGEGADHTDVARFSETLAGITLE